MSLDKALKNIKFDKRLTEIHVHRGIVTKDEVEKYNKDLPDLASNVEYVSLTAADPDEEVETH